MSDRLLTVLSTVSVIYCEDTRQSSILCAKYDINTPLRSLDRFKEKFRVDEILNRLRLGEDIAYISDAGTPAICDPGALVVEALAAEGIFQFHLFRALRQ